MSKWNRQYWTDLSERVASSAIGGALTLPILQTVPSVPFSAELAWTVIGIPAATSLLKGLLVNLGTGDTPTASLVKVTSNGEPDPVHEGL